MIEDLRIRRAAWTDDKLLAAINYDTWPAGTAAGPLPDPAAPFFGTAGATIENTLVAFLPEAVAGFVAVGPDRGSGVRWTVHRVAVATPLHNRGIGMVLIRAASAAAHGAGARELAATPHDSKTRQLLTRCGFTSTDGSPTLVKSPLRRAS